MKIKLSQILREIHEHFAAAPLNYGQGTDNGWDEAVALVLSVAQLPDSQSSLDAPLPDAQVEAMREIARRRTQERQPLAYLLGKATYCGELFEVPPGVLVPRSPIGPLLLGDGLRPWLGEPQRILDLCCGAGCLGILAARCFPNAEVVLADIDALAVDTARRNILKHGLAGAVRAVHTDLFAGLAAASRQASDACAKASIKADEPAAGNKGYDLILCNPPYVDADTMASLPPEFAHEPALALAGGDDGLTLMNLVLSQAGDYLADGGVLVGEVGTGHGLLRARWPSAPFLWPDLPDGGEGVFLLPAIEVRRLNAKD